MIYELSRLDAHISTLLLLRSDVKSIPAPFSSAKRPLSDVNGPGDNQCLPAKLRLRTLCGQPRGRASIWASMARGWESIRKGGSKNAMAQGALGDMWWAGDPSDLSKIYSWRGLHATLKKKPMSIAPIEDLQQSVAVASGNSK
jgi:hypothetical protein